MAGPNTVIRIIAAVLFLLVLAFVTAVGFTLMDSIYLNLQIGENGLGWGDGSTMLMFAGLGLIGLALVVVFWLWIAPVKRDVRQDVRRP